MARYKFGGTAQDGVYSKFAFAGKSLLALADATVTAWTAKTGGTQHTDLLDAAGNPVASIKVTDGQLPEFSGPDGVTELWVDDGDTERHLLVNRQVGPAGPPGPGGSDADTAGYINTAGSASRAAVDSRVTAHANTTTDAHDATAISYAGSTNLAANNVEAALDELDAEKAAVGHSHAVGLWTAYTPTWTAAGGGTPTVGTGGSATFAGFWTRIGDTVIFRIDMTFGTTGPNSGIGAWRWGLPTPHAAAATNYGLLVSGFIEDAGVAGYNVISGRLTAGSTSTFEMLVQSTSGGALASVVGNTTPFTWGIGDFCRIYGSYQAAP